MEKQIKIQAKYPIKALVKLGFDQSAWVNITSWRPTGIFAGEIWYECSAIKTIKVYGNKLSYLIPWAKDIATAVWALSRYTVATVLAMGEKFVSRIRKRVKGVPLGIRTPIGDDQRVIEIKATKEMVDAALNKAIQALRQKINTKEESCVGKQTEKDNTKEKPVVTSHTNVQAKLPDNWALSLKPEGAKLWGMPHIGAMAHYLAFVEDAEPYEFLRYKNDEIERRVNETSDAWKIKWLKKKAGTPLEEGARVDDNKVKSELNTTTTKISPKKDEGTVAKVIIRDPRIYFCAKVGPKANAYLETLLFQSPSKLSLEVIRSSVNLTTESIPDMKSYVHINRKEFSDIADFLGLVDWEFQYFRQTKWTSRQHMRDLEEMEEMAEKKRTTTIKARMPGSLEDLKFYTRRDLKTVHNMYAYMQHHRSVFTAEDFAQVEETRKRIGKLD
jgi:hypothetical protein